MTISSGARSAGSGSAYSGGENNLGTDLRVPGSPHRSDRVVLTCHDCVIASLRWRRRPPHTPRSRPETGVPISNSVAPALQANTA
jgi:hypothetical protein